MNAVDAYQIKYAIWSGLLLWGVDEDGDLEWCGTSEMFRKYRRLCDEHEYKNIIHGRYRRD